MKNIFKKKLEKNFKTVYIWPLASKISDVFDANTGEETFSDISSLSIRLQIDIETLKIENWQYSANLEKKLKAEHQRYLFRKAISSWGLQLTSEEFKHSNFDFSILESYQFVTSEQFVVKSFDGSYFLAGRNNF